MKKILLITLIAVSSILSMEAADAAAELVIRSFVQPTTPVATSRTASFRIDNIGDATSQAFKVRIWASKDKAFSDVPDDGEVFEANSNSVSSSGSGLDGDTPVPLSPINDEGFYAGIQPTVSLPGRGIFWTVSWTLTYDLPLPGDLTPGGKPKPLSSILGDQANFKICIVLINETQCDSAPTSLRQVQSTLVPPIVNDVRVVGSSENELQLTWMEVPFDTFVDDNDVAQEVDFVSKYRIKRLDHLGVTTSTELRPDELDVVMVDGQERFSLTFQLSNDLPRGKRNAFEVESCHDAGAPGVKKLVCDPETPRRPGTSFFRDVAAIERPFSATQGSRSDGVLVSWEVPASFVRRYRLMRCDADSQDNCTPTEVDGALTNFLDTNVQRGKIYEYVISACDRLYANSSNPNDPRIGTCLDNDNSIYKFGKTTPGFVGLVDKFEDDDTPAQATLVSNDVTQLHSFDSTSDDDWLKVILRRPGRLVIETASFAGEQVDTVLTLYDSQQQFIDENDDLDPENAPGSFSKIESEVLPAGEYFIKSEHFELPGGEFPAPTANNYLLSVDYLDAAVNIAPIIQLLLLDEN